MIQSTGLLQSTNPQVFQQYQANDVYSRQDQGQANVAERLIAATDTVT
jgi:hypothetical protein